MTRRQGIFLLIFYLGLMYGCENDGGRKIKLASKQGSQNGNAQTVSTVLQVGTDEQTSLTILNFENRTDNKNLNWLERGLADMLVAKLSQSVYFNLVSMNHLNDELRQLGKTVDDLDQPAVARKISKRIENVLTGSLTEDNEGIQIEAVLHDLKTGRILRRESVRGPDLESILLMVDELSERLRTNLRGDLVAARDKRLKLTDMTQSVEAFQCYSKALEYLDKFLYNEADSCLSKAIELDDTFAAAYLRLAQIKFRLGKSKVAASYLKEARRFSHGLSEPDQITLRLYEAKQEGDIEKIVTALEDFMKFEPEDIDARMQMAGHLKRMCRYDEALEAYETILELDPERKTAYNQLGYLYAERGDFRTGLEYIDKYQQFAADEPNPYDSRGEVLMMAGRFDEAIEQFNIALSKRADFTNSAKRLREAYSETDNLAKALEYSDRAIQGASSKLSEALGHVERAKVLWRFGKIKKAAKTLQKAQQIFPAQVNSVLVGRDMFVAAGNRQAAQKLQRQYLNWFKKTKLDSELDNELLHAMLKFCVQSDLPPEDLLPIVEKITATETRPMQRQVNDIYLALLHLRAGNYKVAEKYCQSQNEIFLQLLTRIPPAPRDEVWKFSIEATQLQPSEENPDYSYFDKLVTVAQQAERKDVEVMARFLRAQYHAKNDRTDDLIIEYNFTGAPLEDDWFVIGPFENRSGFHRQFPPEQAIDLKATYGSGSRTLAWQNIDDGAYDGYVDLKETFQPSSWAVGYGVIYINSPDKRTVQLRIATDEACKMWLNDKLVWQVYRKWPVPIDNDIIPVVLHPGDNKLLIKVTNSLKDWGFYFRVTDEKGNGFPDIKFVPADKKVPA